MEKNVLKALFLLVSIGGFFFQPLSIIATASVLFFLSGYLLIRFLKIEFDVFELLLFSVLSSVLFSSHAVYWLSLLFGYNLFSINWVNVFFALAFLILPKVAGLENGVMRERFRDLFLEHKPGVLFGVLVFALMFALFSLTLWVESPNGFLVGGSNWSDLFAHLPITESLNQGNFPPESPFFAGAPLTYHWFSDFHTAILSKASGVFSALIMRFENALYAALFAIFSYLLAFQITKSRKAALIASVLVIFGGGIGFVNLAQDLLTKNQGVLELVKNNAYDNDWKFFQVPSNMGGFLIPQRAQMVGLAALAAISYLLLARERKKLLLAGFLCAFLAPFHYFAFISAAAIGAIFLVLTHFNVGRSYESKKDGNTRLKNSGFIDKTFSLSFALPRNNSVRKKKTENNFSISSLKLFIETTLPFFAPLVLAIPFALTPFLTVSSAGLLKITPGWLAPKDAFGFIGFYLANLGLPFILAVAGLWLFRIKHKFFISASIAFLLMITNLFTLSGTQWDMVKFLSYLTIFTAIPAAELISRQRKIFFILLVFFSCLTGILIYTWTIQSNWVGLTHEQVAAGEWLKQNTPQNSVVLAYYNHNHAVDSVGGRLRVTGYGGWVYNYGLNGQKREQDLQKAFCRSFEDTLNVMNKYNATYVFLSPDEQGGFKCTLSVEKNPFLEKVYENPQVKIFKKTSE